jgi:LysR family transcriptional regulator (chromosome initiation inhibitor)
MFLTNHEDHFIDVSTAQLSALLAIADLGTFDAAARHLHVTPSAVSQRIRSLESAMGQVLVQRSSPCVPTPAGERLVGVARQTQLLLTELERSHAGSRL